MKAEEKYKIGMFKNVHPDIMKFIHDNSNTVCPFGKYDNTLVCSQYDLIMFLKAHIRTNEDCINSLYRKIEDMEKSRKTSAIITASDDIHLKTK